MSESQSEIHNRVGLAVTQQIVGEVTKNGGSPEAVLVLLESVNTGVLLMLQRLTGWPHDDLDAAAKVVMDQVRQRVALDGKPAGRA